MEEINNTFYAFGWTLMHSMWQAAIITCVLYVVLFIGKEVLSSNSKYVLSVVSLLILLCWSINTYWGFTHSDLSTSGETVFAFDAYLPATTSTSLLANVESFINMHMDLIIYCWLLGLMYSLTRICIGIWGIRQLEKGYLPLRSLGKILEEVKTDLGITLDVRIGESVRTNVPVVLGHLRPVILFPLEFITGMNKDHIRLIIAHELAHIRRNDYLVNIVQRIVEAIYFYNPFVWVISNRIKMEREFACDDIVLRMAQPNAYANALLSSYDNMKAPPFTMGFNGSNQSLVSRLNRIMKRNMKNRKRGNLLPMSILVIMLIGFVWMQKNNVTRANNLDGGVRFASLFTESVEVVPVGINMDLDGFKYRDTIPEIRKIEIPDNSDDWEEDYDYSFRFLEELESLDFLVDIDVQEMADISTNFNFDFDPDLNFRFDPNLKFDFDPNINFDTNYAFNFDFDTIPRIEMKQLEESLRSMEMHQRELQEYFENNQELFKGHQEMAARLQLKLTESFERLEMDQLQELEKLEGMEQEMEEMVMHQMRELEEQLQHLPHLEEELEKMEDVLKEELRHLEEFETDIKKALKKDGYWEEGDELEVTFGEDYLEIDGEKIKGKEFEKYLKIKERYFPQDEGKFRYRMN